MNRKRSAKTGGLVFSKIWIPKEQLSNKKEMKGVPMGSVAREGLNGNSAVRKRCNGSESRRRGDARGANFRD